MKKQLLQIQKAGLKYFAQKYKWIPKVHDVSTEGRPCLIIEPRSGNNGEFDGMQIIFEDGTYELSEYQAGPNQNELHVFGEYKTINAAYRRLLKGKKQPIQIWNWSKQLKNNAMKAINETQKALKRCLDSLHDHQATLFEQGHDFWHCDAHDTNSRGEYIPFRYYQTNRSIHMSTCGTCYKLMELRKQIRQVEKLLSLPLTPLYTKITSKNKVKRMCVNDSSEFNPNYNYL